MSRPKFIYVWNGEWGMNEWGENIPDYVEEDNPTLYVNVELADQLAYSIEELSRNRMDPVLWDQVKDALKAYRHPT